MTTKAKPTFRRRTTPVLDPWLTINEAADHAAITTRKLRSEIKAGRIRAYQLGPRTTRIKLSDLEAAMEPIAVGGAA